jgi:hypothetical protein
VKAWVFGAVSILLLSTGVGTYAQGVSPAAAQQNALLEARQEVFVMEGILDGAIGYASQALARKVAQGPVTEMLLAGVTRTRGFRLEGYGVFFDVEYPLVRESVSRMMWNVQSSPEASLAIITALRDLSADLDAMAQQADPEARRELQSRMRAFESQIQPFLVTAGRTTDRVTMTGAPVSAYVDNIKDVYVEEIQQSLTDAILNHGAPLGVSDAEWLTVAARASQGRMLVPGDVNALGPTLILRIRGVDLKALRDGRLSKEDARQRVEVRQY